MKVVGNDSKYRNRLQIIAEILRTARKGARKTRIMYQANLSYDLLNRYLAETLEADLLTINKDEKLYMVTRKGEEFLEKYGDYSERCMQLQEQLENNRKDETFLKSMCSNLSDEEK